MHFDMLINTRDSHLSPLPVIKEMASLDERNQLHKFLRNVIWGDGVFFRSDNK
ncbi:rCG43958 [Rattus norvegicus]|uniref:RCG43958 n=1 Tax=Rattus norvegicus TaxID=10116 RepID=A6J7A0_RAT|nr:rCG43958 [Rattus norvegicus]